MKALKYLNKYFIKYRYRLGLGIVFSVIAQIFTLFMPRLIGQSLKVVELYQKGQISSLAEVKHQLFINIVIIIGAVLGAGIFTFGMRQMIIVMSRYIEFDLKNEIYEQYQRLSLNFYKKNKTGDLMNRISEDVSKVRMYFGPAIMYTINMITLFIIVTANMVRIDLQLTLYTLIPLPFLSVSIYILSSVINKRSTVVQQYLSKLTTYAQETFSGINVIKAYGIETKNYDEFDDLAEISKDKNISLFKAQALFFPLMILLIGISNIFVIYFGGMQYINGKIESLSIIAEFIIYINMLTWPVAVVGWVSSMVQQAEASQKRINGFLNVKPEIENTQVNSSVINGTIEFKKVSFTYDDTHITALKNVSFKIDSGKTLAILGKTGSGKSTVINLIARLYDIDNGAILIDGIPIKEINLKCLRENIGFVPQDSFLFSDTIANNIRFGNEEASLSRIKNAAKQANIHENIKAFKNSYQTLVGERGVTLSGGQKQRISIARALIKNPNILIFDDCLSAVDTETEEIILSNLNKLIHHKTAIIVSHRVSSVKNADTIIVLDEGKIIQHGSHLQLLNQNGYYQELYEQQLLERQ
ncbi:MAG: ABC transporter ATP-binding protein/permease [Flavobacteriaceae bacterium]|nr:ABC transporter ATP-binding protein/permease [Flavobacteriaceae bacterium]